MNFGDFSSLKIIQDYIAVFKLDDWKTTKAKTKKYLMNAFTFLEVLYYSTVSFQFAENSMHKEEVDSTRLHVDIKAFVYSFWLFAVYQICN